MNRFRPTWVEVDLDAIRHNVRLLRPDGAELMAVVKADAYGHGDVAVARAALEAGAAWIGVALVEEGLRLRDAGIDAPILVLSEFPPGSESVALDAGLTPSLYSDGALERLVAAAGGRDVGVHVKVDTGMHRAGVYPSDATPPFVERAIAAGLRLDASLDPFRELRRGREDHVDSSWNASSPRSKTSASRGSSRTCCTPRTAAPRSCIPRPTSTGPNRHRDVRAGARPRASVTLWISVRRSRGAPR